MVPKLSNIEICANSPGPTSPAWHLCMSRSETGRRCCCQSSGVRSSGSTKRWRGPLCAGRGEARRVHRLSNGMDLLRCGRRICIQILLQGFRIEPLEHHILPSFHAKASLVHTAIHGVDALSHELHVLLEPFLRGGGSEEVIGRLQAVPRGVLRGGIEGTF